MDRERRESLFDDWASQYDEFISRAEGFPFEDYDDMLATIVAMAQPHPNQRVLDIGAGTGRLAALFAAKGSSRNNFPCFGPAVSRKGRCKRTESAPSPHPGAR